MEDQFITPVVRLLLAMVAGALIGSERTYYGRPAGFRTHTLVCTASGLLMLLTVFQTITLPNIPIENIRIDPTRMAQGIMTGIGFLGAGVILRDRLTIRGLTTAASIWMTAAIGIMIGVGLLFAALIAEVITLGTLSVLRWIEEKAPTFNFARIRVRFNEGEEMAETELREMIVSHGITCSNSSYFLEDRMIQYEMTIRTREAVRFGELAESLKDLETVRDFSIIPTTT